MREAELHDLPALDEATPVLEAALLLYRHASPLPVLTVDGKLKGMLSRRALIAHLRAHARADRHPVVVARIGRLPGGNGTLVGASRNVVVAGLAARAGHPIRFLPFMVVAFPLRLAGMAESGLYLWPRHP